MKHSKNTCLSQLLTEIFSYQEMQVNTSYNSQKQSPVLHKSLIELLAEKNIKIITSYVINSIFSKNLFYLLLLLSSP